MTTRSARLRATPAQAREAITEDLVHIDRVSPREAAVVREWIDGLADEDCLRILRFHSLNRSRLPLRMSEWQDAYSAWRKFRMTLEDELAGELPAKPVDDGFGDINKLVSDDEINRILGGGAHES